MYVHLCAQILMSDFTCLSYASSTALVLLVTSIYCTIICGALHNACVRDSATYHEKPCNIAYGSASLRHSSLGAVKG